MTCPAKAPSASMSLVAGMLALSSSAALAESVASSRVIKCEGPFGRNAGHSDLVKAFGSKNVVEQEIDGAEGQKIKASVLYPDDPKARLEFIWSDEKGRRRPSLIRADGSDRPGPTANGIRIGTALAEIEADERQAVQAAPASTGTMAAGVTDWQGGALEQAAARRLHPAAVEFRPPGGLPPEAHLAKVTGDGEFLSDNTDCARSSSRSLGR